VLTVVVVELAGGQEVVLVILSSTCECAQVPLYHLIDVFGLTVGLGVISHQKCQFDP
jgi:hypothetical protein